MSENLLRLSIAGFFGGFYRIKAFTFLVIILLSLAGDGYANVIITAASGGTNICSSTAVGGSAPRHTTLGNITFTEGSNNDLAGPATDILVLSAPAGWQFSTDTVPTITYILGANITTVPVFTLTATTMTISITTNGTNAPDQFFISGLRVQATATSSAAGNIYPSSATGIAGLVIGTSGTNFGSLSLMSPLVPSVTVTASPPGAICPGTNVLFLSNPVNGGTAPTYQWFLNGSSIATGATYSNNALTNGNAITCTMTANGSCMTATTANSNVYTMSVLTGPLPVNGASVTCPGTTITLSDNTAGGTWSSSNTAIAQTNGLGDVTGISVGAAIISYISGNGCPSVANITVNEPPYAPVLTTTLTTMCSGNVTALTATGTPYPTTILTQNFNSGIAPWTVDSSGSIGTLPGSAWKDCGNGYINEEGIYFSYDSSAFAMTNSDTSGASSYTSSKLTSPVFSLVGYSGATLAFQQAYEYWPAGDSIVSVQISTDGGTTWATMQNYVGADVGNRTNFVGETFSLNAYLGQSNLRLRFYYYCHWGYYWAVDNVLVTGVSSLVIPIWSPTTDLFTNAACTTAYTSGTALGTVYMHPPVITLGGTITYTATAVGTGCAAVTTTTVNFNPSPSGIIGNSPLCAGATTNLSDATTGGTWSSGNIVIATVGSGTGAVAAMVTGTAYVSYTLGTGCAATAIITVNALPAAIAGNEGVCIGSTTSLSDDTTGGWWTSGNTAIATIGPGTGVVTSVATGSATITYTIGTGCNSVAAITVNPLPDVIDGDTSVCMGLTTSLSDANTGGVWTSGATAIATAGTGSGIITGITAGSATITYTLGTGCRATTNVTVNPLQAIAGVKSVCAGSTTSLSDGITGGTWGSSNTIAATVAAGVVTGQAAGSAVISYTLPTGCITTTIVTVNPLPNVILGVPQVCIGFNTSLSDATPGGVWSSGLAGIATIGSTGLVHGVGAGSTGIRYTLSTGCFVTQLVTVNSLPQAILGGMIVCATLATTLSDVSGGGTWASGNSTIATVGSSGIVNGVLGGTADITYTLATGCTANTVVTVNPLPVAISGNNQVCSGLTNTLSDGTSSGTWSSSATSIAMVGSSSGVVTGASLGSVNITYTLLTGCIITMAVTVDPLPGSINGLPVVCAGSTTTLSDTSNGGVWTSGSGAATVGPGTGVVSGVSGGNTVITYTLPTGCLSTKSVTVNPLPDAISGVVAICVGLTTALSDVTLSGTWSSSNTLVGNIGSTGVVTAAGAGTTNVTYTLNTGCFATATVTVTALPQAISGSRYVCQQSSDSLGDVTAGGMWSSSNTINATIGSLTGIVSGLVTGTTMISYTIPIAAGVGCTIAETVTVNQTPGNINGIAAICAGAATSLTDNTPGGTWSSNSTGVATIGASSGSVSGLIAGNSIVTYILGDGCIATEVVTINVMPTAISGITNVCAGLTTSLSDNVTGGAWTSSSTSIASIGSTTGTVAGNNVGSANITYGFATGCVVTTLVTVNVTPGSISGNVSVCLGFTTSLSDGTPGGVWTSGNTSFATIGSGSGLVATSLAGIATISYTLPTGCAASKAVTINPQPSVIGGTISICAGTVTVLTDLIAGGTWSSSNTEIATIGSSSGLLTGTGSGTTTISYSLDAGCVATIIVTVHLLPSSIAGSSVVCAGSTVTLSDPIHGGGTWSSSSITVATIGSGTGIITGISAGTTTITYSLGVGCTLATIVTVNPLPAGIIEPANLCFNSSIVLSDSTGGGTWSSGNTAIAGIGPLTGIVSGSTTGSTSVTYMLTTGCLTQMALTVYPLPAPITGTATVCVGLSTNLSDNTAGGTWSSASAAIAANGTGAGIINGISAGSTSITYTLGTGCFVSDVATVNPLPQAIGGSNVACAGLSANLTDATNGGSWSSGSTGIATVGSTTGVVNGIVAGTSNITYTLPTGCTSTLLFTVEPLPAAINGPVNVCQGLTINLTDGTGGGAWGSSNISIASIGSVSGVLTGNSVGSALVTYTLNTGCLITKNVTVNPLPYAVYGVADVCIGSATALSDSTTGGAWSSSNTAIGSIGTGSGVVTGIENGTADITYTTNHGCIATYPVTVNPLPAIISGLRSVCAGGTTYLSDSLAGGTWNSGTAGIAGIGSVSGIVHGNMQGTTTITYTSGYGCIVVAVVTVNPLPTTISGLNNVCAASTITLTDSSPGGIWSSSNIANATIGTASGIASGALAGSTIVTYTLVTGCLTSTTITINPLPSMIAGDKNVCQGLTTSLSDTLTGGTWVSSSTGIATIGSASGVVSGVLAGTSMVIYTLPTGCSIPGVVTVNPLPLAISGNTTFCVGLTTNLTDPTPGGSWSSGSPGVGMVGSGTGVVTGLSAGTAMITYSLVTGCINTTTVTVNTLAPISGATFICSGNTAILNDAGGTGIWSSTNSSVAAIGSLTGSITGNVSGTATISFVLGAGCITSTVVTVNSLPSSIGGPTNVCAGLSINLTDGMVGGSWSSSALPVATIGSSSGVLSGIVAGVTSVTYTVGGTGCAAFTSVTVNPLPGTINGIAAVCKGLTVSLSDSTSPGVWGSGNASVASIGSGSGIVNGIAAGTSTVTFTLPTGCITTATVTVNPLPSAIMGMESVCAGFTTNLSDSATSGSWSSTESPGIVAVDAVAGTVTGVATGTATITYTLPTGCVMNVIVTVNPLPPVIRGANQVCMGLTISLSDFSSGGTWVGNTASVATIGPGSGIVSGIAPGTTKITYTLPTGCATTTWVTVNALPAVINGIDSVCAGLTTTLSDATTGGVWGIISSSGIASVDSVTGVVTGISAGTVIVTYTLPTGCIATAVVTVHSLPLAISGTANVCTGLTTNLTDGTSAGTWSSASPGIAAIGSSTGIVTGIGAGAAIITYMLGTGCIATVNVTVNPLPALPSVSGGGANTVCAGSVITLIDATMGGTWTSGATGIAAIGSNSGVVSGLVSGTVMITYALGTGCISTAVVTVNPLPAAINGAMRLCAGLSVNLGDITGTGTWSSSMGAIGSVGSSGAVTGVSAGTTTVSYVLSTGCQQVAVVTVNPLPATITGAASVCTGLTTGLNDTSSGGAWGIATGSIATIGSATGIVTGISTGTGIITYTLLTGCITTTTVTVLPSPVAITGTRNVCAGLTTTLSDITIGGTWASASTATATAGSLTGIVTGIAAGVTGISYTAANGCFVVTAYTVNALPLTISGNRSVCIGATSVLSDSMAGGSWGITGASGIASIGPASGIVTGASLGTAIVTYTLPTGCITNTEVTVNPYPAAITGGLNVCQGATINLSDVTPGGAWGSGNTTVATVTVGSGIVTGTGGGSATISYTLPTGCYVVKQVSVNPIFPISGYSNICAGGTKIFSDVTTGGAWSSNNTVVATITSGTGIVHANVSGTTIIYYELSTSCITSMIITVNALPASFNVMGGGNYCAGGTGAVIGLNGSDTGVRYTIYSDTSVIATIAGIGSPIYYGPYTMPGIYDIVAVNNLTGCTDTMAGAATIGISPLIMPSISISTATGDTVCAGANTVFTALAINGGAAPAYNWYVNGTHVSSSGNTYSFIPVTGNVVSVILASDAMCAAPDTVSNSFNVITTPYVIPSLSIAASPGDTVCGHEPVTVIPTPVYGGSAPVYRWVKNGVTTAMGGTYTYTPANGDNIFCVLHSNYRCLTTDTANSSDNVNFRVIPSVIPDVAITAHPGITIANGGHDTLIAIVGNASAGTLTYQWAIDNVPVSGATNDTFTGNTFVNNDTISCTVTITAVCGGIPATAKVVISVGNTGISNVIASPGYMGLLPNPNNGQFILKGNLGNQQNSDVGLQINNMLGQLIFEKNIHAVEGIIDEAIDLGPALPNGLYFLHLSANGSPILSAFHFVINR